MGYPIHEVIIESVLRDGFQRIRDNIDTILPDVFSFFLEDSFSVKYGQKEIDRIKEILLGREVPIHHAVSLGIADEFSVSIELLNEGPHQDFLDSHRGHEEISKTPTTIVSSVVLLGGSPYEELGGILSIDDSINLSNVYPNHLYKDASDSTFTIISVNNTIGSKALGFEPALALELDASGNGSVISSIDYTQYSVNVAGRTPSIMVVAHSKDPLRTKYLYVLLKYILNYGIEDLIARGFGNPVINGLNYQQDPNFKGDLCYMKAIQIDGYSEDAWRSVEAPGIERVEIDTTVEKDVVNTEQANRTDQGVTITED